MRRCVILLLALAAAAAFAPARADAKVPCRDKIFGQWYRDGTVASTYPLACYRDALKHIPSDVKVYTGMADDIRLGLQAAIDKSHGKAVPEQVSSRLTSSSPPPSDATTTSSPPPSSPSTPPSKHPTPASTAPDETDAGGGVSTTPAPTPASTVAAAPTDGSSGVPVPVLVLGGVALVLVASGAIGLGVRRFRRGH